MFTPLRAMYTHGPGLKNKNKWWLTRNQKNVRVEQHSYQRIVDAVS